MSNHITAHGHEGDPDYGRDYEFNGGSLPTQYEWLRICQDAERYVIERREDWPYKTEDDAADDAADDADLRIYIGMYTEDEIPEHFDLQITKSRYVRTDNIDVQDMGGWDDEKKKQAYDLFVNIPVREIRRAIGLRRRRAS